MAGRKFEDIRKLLKADRSRRRAGHSRMQLQVSVSERQMLNTIRAEGGLITEERFTGLVAQYGAPIINHRDVSKLGPGGRSNVPRPLDKAGSCLTPGRGGRAGASTSSSNLVSPIKKDGKGPRVRGGRSGQFERALKGDRRRGAGAFRDGGVEGDGDKPRATRVYELLNNALASTGTERIVRTWVKWERSYYYVLGDCGKVDAYCHRNKLPEKIRDTYCDALRRMIATLMREGGMLPLKPMYACMYRDMKMGREKCHDTFAHMQRNGYIGRRMHMDGQRRGESDIWIGPRVLALDEEVVEWYASFNGGSACTSMEAPPRNYAFDLDSDDERDFM